MAESFTNDTYCSSVHAGQTQGTVSYVAGAKEGRVSSIRTLISMGFTIYAMNPDEEKAPRDNQERHIVDRLIKRRV